MTWAVWRMAILNSAEEIVSALGCRCGDPDVEPHSARKVEVAMS